MIMMELVQLADQGLVLHMLVSKNVIWFTGLSVRTVWLEFYLWWHVIWNDILGGSFLVCVEFMLFVSLHGQFECHKPLCLSI